MDDAYHRRCGTDGPVDKVGDDGEVQDVDASLQHGSAASLDLGDAHESKGESLDKRRLGRKLQPDPTSRNQANQFHPYNCQSSYTLTASNGNLQIGNGTPKSPLTPR